MNVHAIIIFREVVCAKFAHCFSAQQMVFANFATTTILQITFPTSNSLHDLHVIRLVMYANLAHVSVSFKFPSL